MKFIEICQRMTRIEKIHSDDTLTDFSINLENQKVQVLGAKGRTKTVERTIYRVDLENETLTGRLLRRNSPDHKWQPYRFDAEKQIWVADDRKEKRY